MEQKGGRDYERGNHMAYVASEDQRGLERAGTGKCAGDQASLWTVDVIEKR